MARTFRPIDWDKVELYLKAGSSQKNIACSLGITPDTLRDRVKEKFGVEYSVYSSGLQSTGQLLIEATQLQKALSGNIQMLLWLGKVRCGQKEADLLSSVPPSQDQIDKDHLIMQLQHRLATLEGDGNKSKTE